MHGAVLEVMCMPKIMPTGVEVFPVHGDKLCVVPGGSVTPGAHPKEDIGVVREILCQSFDNFGAVGLMETV